MGYKLNLDIETIKDTDSALIKLKRIREKIWMKVRSQFIKDFDKKYKNKWLIRTLDNCNIFIFKPTKAGFGELRYDGFDVVMEYEVSFTISHTNSMWKNAIPGVVNIAWDQFRLLKPKEWEKLITEVSYKLKSDTDSRTKALNEFKNQGFTHR